MKEGGHFQDGGPPFGIQERLYTMVNMPLTVSDNHTRGIGLLLLSGVVVVI
jgi:hypothetical protein